MLYITENDFSIKNDSIIFRKDLNGTLLIYHPECNYSKDLIINLELIVDQIELIYMDISHLEKYHRYLVKQFYYVPQLFRVNDGILKKISLEDLYEMCIKF